MASYTPAPTSTASSSTPSSYGPRPTTVATADVTGSVVAPKSAPSPAPSANWTWDGGTAVTVAQGETIETIGRRYGVPASAIMQANNITAPGTIHPGQQLVIPRYSQTSAAAAPAPVARPVVATPKPASTPVPAGPKLASVPSNPGVHVVAPGDTLTKIARRYGKPVHEITKANNLIAGARLNVGDRLVIPGVHASAAKPNMTPKPRAGRRAGQAHRVDGAGGARAERQRIRAGRRDDRGKGRREAAGQRAAEISLAGERLRDPGLRPDHQRPAE
jgi:LysM repeat protein